jgi:3-oxoacyl-[acyl-carrier-protein] synthase-3
MGARIVGTGSAIPLTCLTNEDLAIRVNTNHDWIVTRTGIHERHVMKQGEDLLDLMYEASSQALNAAGMKARDLQAIVVCRS